MKSTLQICIASSHLNLIQWHFISKWQMNYFNLYICMHANSVLLFDKRECIWDVKLICLKLTWKFEWSDRSIGKIAAICDGISTIAYKCYKVESYAIEFFWNAQSWHYCLKMRIKETLLLVTHIEFYIYFKIQICIRMFFIGNCLQVKSYTEIAIMPTMSGPKKIEWC